ncbi:MAG: hypothetical protein HYW02_07210 [Deltaproteobacteria bacterium]|nr:hypothetical protein [Deltaproteobacteria bacterium]MBI2501229.1 hypothetical protein [Deltaproteobacteria bacterium]
MSQKNWRLAVQGGTDFTTDYLHWEGPGGTDLNDKREESPQIEADYRTLTLSCQRDFTLKEGGSSREPETYFIAPRTDFSYSQFHAFRHYSSDAPSHRRPEIDIHSHKMRLQGGLSTGVKIGRTSLFDSRRLLFESEMSLFFLLGPEIIPAHDRPVGDHSSREPSTWNLTSMRTGLTIGATGRSGWGIIFELAAINGWNPAPQRRQWGGGFGIGMQRRF